jgi:hypothetical protein
LTETGGEHAGVAVAVGVAVAFADWVAVAVAVVVEVAVTVEVAVVVAVAVFVALAVTEGVAVAVGVAVRVTVPVAVGVAVAVAVWVDVTVAVFVEVAVAVAVEVAVTVAVAVVVPVEVGVGVAVSVPVAVGVTVAVVATAATTLKPSEALDGSYPAAPAKLALSVELPPAPAVTEQEPTPFEFVVAMQPELSIARVTCWPDSKDGGVTDSSNSVALKLTDWLANPVVGLLLRLINVTCEPEAQVTTARFELRLTAPTVDDALIVSVPACAAV